MNQFDQLVDDGRSQRPIRHHFASSNARHRAWSMLLRRRLSIVSKREFSILRDRDRAGVTDCGRFAHRAKQRRRDAELLRAFRV
jgi:hypothetical protein